MFKAVIVSHLGELTKDVRTLGDSIRYKIYYDNNPQIPGREGEILPLREEIVITDPLDEGLAEIVVRNGGHYDPATHTITWRLGGLPQSRQPFVEFEGVVRAIKPIRNRAFLTVPGLRRVRTNIVESAVTPPPPVGWIPLVDGAAPGEPPRAYMKDETTMGATVRFDIPGLFVYEERVDGVAYQRVAIPAWARRTDLGEPELPICGQMIEVPFGVGFTPEIVKAERITLEGYNVYPVQQPPIAGPARPEPFTIDRKTYLAHASYPGDLGVAADEDIGVVRGHRVMCLKVNPVQYDPAARTLTAYSMIEVRLNYSRPAQLTAIDQRIASPAFEELLRASLLNYKEPERFAAAGGGGGEVKTGCDYLIIAADALYNNLDPKDPITRLRDWKQRKGWRTKVVKAGSLPGGNTAAAIKAYIQDAYDHWSPAPTYVLLVGDADQVPSHGGSVHPNEKEYSQPPVETDLYFATVDGASDYFPDILVGRLSVDSTQQLANVVDKILTYEQDPPATPAHDAFFINTTLISLCQDTYNKKTVPDGQEAFPWIATVESIRQYLQSQHYNVERIYATNSGFPATAGTPSPARYQDGTPLPNNLLAPNYGWDGDTGDIAQAFDDGRFLVTYLAHGSPTSWGHPSFGTADIAALRQNDLTPVVFSITCQTGWFDNETDDDTRGGLPAGSDCFAEALLRQPRAGAVAAIAQTRVSYVDWNGFILLGMYKGLWPQFAPAPPWSEPTVPATTPPRLTRMGQLLNYGKMFMAQAFTGSTYRTVEFELGHLFGDPEMPVWIQAPAALKVAHPASIYAGGLQEFIVTVVDAATGKGIPDAAVVLTRKGDIVLQRHTGSDGCARLKLLKVGSGDLDITVTALSFRPYLGMITVADAGLNVLDPSDGPEGQVIHVGGFGFMAGETIDLALGDQAALATAVADASGLFGQGILTVDVSVPKGFPHGSVNLVASGQTSGRSAVGIFHVRDVNPVDLWAYSQWDQSTWWLHPGDNPTWNSPDIALYDSGNNPVASDNLVFGQTYTVEARVHNSAAFRAPNAQVTFSWCNYGAGGPWDLLDVQSLDVPDNPPGIAVASTTFTPPGTGHMCLKASIEHVEDITPGNNEGQENLHIGYTSSPAEVCFTVWNLTAEPAPVHLEVRQLIDPSQTGQERLWATWVRHPDPQVLKPGEHGQACVIIDPDVADVTEGARAEFAITGFIAGKMIGGLNVIMIKR